MDDAMANDIKAQLDLELSKLRPDVGIAFGLELFDAFKDRNWIGLNKFSVLGTGFAATLLPCYGSHYAFPTWGA
jgi:hypothetical protein